MTVHKRAVLPYSPDEVARLISAAEGERLGPFYVGAMSMGVRPEEGPGLQWHLLDLDGKPLLGRIRRGFRRPCACGLP